MNIMKKIKIMLTLIAVLAIVGGALAFKAESKWGFTYCTTSAANGHCDIPIQSTILNNGKAHQQFFTTNPVNGSCTPGVTDCPKTTLYVE